MIKEEVKLQRLCCANSNNIVQIFDVFDSGALVDIVLEPMMKDDLFDAIKKVYYADTANNKYSELEASKIIRQIISAVGACHAHSVCHRDLKPENILVYKYGERGDGVDHHAMVVKLCDFGLATKLAPGQKLTDACGTPEYVAPEVVSKMVDEAPSYDFAADIWSVGVILYILLSGEQPFHSESEDARRNTAEVLQQVRKHKSLQDKFDSEPEVWSAVSAQAKTLLNVQMLARDGSKRPSAKDLLLNPWITGADADTTHNSAALAKQHRRWLRRKFRAAIYAMVATNRIRSFVHNLRAAKVTATEDGCTAEAYSALLDAFRAGTSVAGTSVEECLVEQVTTPPPRRAALRRAAPCPTPCSPPLLAGGVCRAPEEARPRRGLRGRALRDVRDAAHGRRGHGARASLMARRPSLPDGARAQTLNYRDYCVGLGWRTASADSMKVPRASAHHPH